TVQVSKSVGEHEAESSFTLRRSPRVELQKQRALQLEMHRSAMKERRSSMTEIDKQRILEQRRRAYEMIRSRVRDVTNIEDRPGPGS
ncbi:hypothetical protein MKW92_048220, partial [Papaver armeniacum]